MRTSLLILFCSTMAATTLLAEKESQRPANFRDDQLIAWCIVPFDASKRGPAERAAMVSDLGLKRVAYDWRQEHVSQFEEEIQQYQKNDIEFFAFWSWHDSLEPLIRKYNLKPQIWRTVPSPQADSQAAKVSLAAEQLAGLAKKADSLGCQFGLYNHGGWGGQPENMVAVCRYLREEHGLENVGLVYNFHHGHEHIERFESAFKKMQPYLLCLNLNGMADPATVKGHQNKILPIGQGKHEAEMIGQIIKANYKGPIGILDHRNELDSKESLQLNLQGLETLLSDNLK